MAETLDAATLLKNSGGDRPPRAQRTPTAPEPEADPIKELEDKHAGEDLSRDEKKLRDELSQFYTMVGMGAMVVDMELASAVISNGESAATAWVLYARTNPKVKRALKKFTETSAVGTLVMAHVPMVMAAVPVVQAKISGKPVESQEAPEPVPPTERYDL